MPEQDNPTTETDPAPDTEAPATTTIELGFQAETTSGQHDVTMTVTFPTGLGLVAATALASKMDDVIGPAFMQALAESKDESMLALMTSLGLDHDKPLP